MSIPSFSSFPELPSQSSDRKEGGDSNTANAAFSSFPDLQLSVAGPSRSRPKHESDRRAYREERHSERRQRSRSHERRRERDVSFDRDERDEKRHRSSRDKERRKRRDDDDEEDRTLRKEERRRRERLEAERLVRGESSASGRRPEDPVAPKTISWNHGDDKAWYESVIGPRTKGYEAPFDPTSSSAWFSDTVGDKDAIRYSAAASYSAPKYARDHHGRVLGLNDGVRIVLSRNKTEKGVELAPKGRPHMPRYSAKTLDGSASRHLGRVLLRPDGSADFDSNAPFVAISYPRSQQLDIDDIPDYRSLTGPQAVEEEDVEAGDSTLSGYSTLEEDLRRQTAEIEGTLKIHPDNVELWIKYSTLHLKMSPETYDRSVDASMDPLSLPQNRAQAEVTLSILARALDAHPKNFLSPSLHIAYIRAAEMFWPADQVTRRWKNVIRELSERIDKPGMEALEKGMISIWLGYIEWREGQGFGKVEGGSAGGVDEVIEVYVECLNKLSGGALNASSQIREENQLYLFLRACLFLKQAGYVERALACFQAMMEITFFKPDRLRPTAVSGKEWFDALLIDFEEFWDEEMPRFGEPRSKGWRDARSEDMEHVIPPEAVHVTNNPFEKWLEAERHSDKMFGRPGRTKNLDDEDDPYRVVLFSDIQPLLFPIRSPAVRLQLVYAYLTFIGLPFDPPEVPSTSPTASDPYLRSALAYNDSARAAFWPPKFGARRIPWQTVGGEPMTPEQSTILQHPYGCPVKCWASERSTLFAQSAKWFRDLELVELSHVDIDLARQSFILLRPLVPDPAFTLAYFAFEAAVSPKAAVKASKAILAEERDNLVLWDGYARLERQRGNVAAARAVYAAALQAALAREAVDEEDKLEVWASWAEMEFEQEEPRCLEVVLMAAGFDVVRLASTASPDHTVSPPSAITMLKARQRFKSSNPPYGPSQLILSALFAYLADGVDSCRDTIVRQLERVPNFSSYAEEAHQLLVKILQLHTSRHSSPAALSRDALQLAIQSFPNNTLFLSLYLFGELGNRVYGRAQKLIYKLSTSEDAGVVGHLWAVWAEAMSSHRTFWDRGGGGAERVRDALDRAINSRTGRHSVLLWELYIEFETMMGKHSSAKSLCYRAITAIGGCKELYLLPFTADLRPHFSTYDLQNWAEMMIERGIRLRIPFESYFEMSAGEDMAMVLPEDEELQDDELAFLRDREDLKPY